MNVDLGSVYPASGPIADFTIVAFGKSIKASVGDALVPSVVPAASGVDGLIGVTGKAPPRTIHSQSRDGGPWTPIPAAPNGRTSVAVIHLGMGSVIVGGPVRAGDHITADSNGRGVVAAAGDRFVGIALEDGDVGQGVELLVQLGQLPAVPVPARAARGT